MSSIFDKLPLSGLVEAFTNLCNRSEVDSVMDNCFTIIRDHTVRKDTGETAVAEVQNLVPQVVKLRHQIRQQLSVDPDDQSFKLPDVSDVNDMSSEEAQDLKRKISQLNSAVDKKLSEGKGG